MTSNAIAAMRLQEERRHNQAQEDLENRGQKRAIVSNLLGATFRGLGTGLLDKVGKAVGATNAVTYPSHRGKIGRNGGNRNDRS